MIENINEKIRAYALKNAIAYKGKASSGSVLSSLFNEGLEKSEVKDVMPTINEIILEISKLSLEEMEREFLELQSLTSKRQEREGLPELPNSEKGVIMRFRPAPSGPMHVGHVISNLVSSLYVERYGGKFYVIFDDTDPEAAIKETYEKLIEDCNWIFGNVHEFLYSSSRMELYYNYAKKLIEKKSAYICKCSQEKFKDLVEKREECPCRNKSIEENIKDWEKMFDSKNGFKQGEAVLRFKTPESHGGLNNPNPAMRDFPLARINETPHALQGTKYRVWPLMNLVVSVDDMELGMTHVIRGKDHKDNAERQKMIFELFNKKYPWTFFIGRIKFTDLVLSKRKITELIESGVYSGWDDPKLPTVSSLRKRGYTRRAFSKFLESRGLTESDKVISAKDFFDVIDRLNKI